MSLKIDAGGGGSPGGANRSSTTGDSWWETIKIVIHALIIAMVVRVFFYQPFNIPSGSMKSTLLIGDYLFVSKLSYGYSRYSFPFGLPPFSGRVFASAPKRGDVAVFKLPRDNSTDYIKRVIGLPGDTIEMRQGVLFINGQAVPKRRVDTFADVDEDGIRRNIPRFEETLPNGVKYLVLDAEPNGPYDNVGPYNVPAGHYFMMGDNRDNSTDSRATYQVGYVPYENLVGRADIIFFSYDGVCPDALPETQPIRFFVGSWCTIKNSVRFGRLFNLVR
ncbi:MAG: signal peptidase I [Hyphomicrobiales bacterium]|nr:signal peptidase I [Hyphomicrobiales bacterium]